MPKKKQEGGKYIVMLENEEQYSRVAALKLSIEGYEIKTIPTVEEFFKSIKKRQPDLIFLDMILEGQTGFDVLEKLKKDAKLKNIKVIVYSSLAQPDDKAKALSLGAVDYMVKSEISLHELVETVKQYI